MGTAATRPALTIEQQIVGKVGSTVAKHSDNDLIRAAGDLGSIGLDLMEIAEGEINPLMAVKAGINLFSSGKDLFSLTAKTFRNTDSIVGDESSLREHFFPLLEYGVRKGRRRAHTTDEGILPSNTNLDTLDTTSGVSAVPSHGDLVHPYEFTRLPYVSISDLKRKHRGDDLFTMDSEPQPHDLRPTKRFRQDPLPPDPYMTSVTPVAPMDNHIHPFNHDGVRYSDAYYDTRIRYPNGDVMPYYDASLGYSVAGADLYGGHSYGYPGTSNNELSYVDQAGANDFMQATAY